MKTKNLLTHSKGASALFNSTYGNNIGITGLKDVEIRVLEEFCMKMKKAGCSFCDLDGFFIGYTIEQISKEFDYLRFGDNYILNIEMKSELKKSKADNEAIVQKQLQKNYYYLTALQKELILITFVEKDGFYKYNNETNCIERISSEQVASYLKKQDINYDINPDDLFKPSNYLISPFNSTDRFIKNEYFLTTAQQEIKKEILENSIYAFYCLTANAGTGKTLLLYDIAHTLLDSGKKILIIHCGKLNNGHYKLQNEYRWNVISAKEINREPYNYLKDDLDFIFVDEAQRIREGELDAIITFSIQYSIPVMFSYDTKQYLRQNETRDIYDYIQSNFQGYSLCKKRLTNRIRTNKAMSSFIVNMFNIGKSNEDLNYDSVSVEYIDNEQELEQYISFLNNNDWEAIVYTTSQYNIEPYSHLVFLSEKNAHDVIGQEFSKVVVVMDQNFKYKNKKLVANNSYYDAIGMIYQIVTRVVDELKIIVLNNLELYIQLNKIKYKDD